jgi:hypothetical protein
MEDFKLLSELTLPDFELSAEEIEMVEVHAMIPNNSLIVPPNLIEQWAKAVLDKTNFVKYPFQFQEMLLTDGVLDALGFTPYHDSSGDFGTRTFGEYTLVEYLETDDPDAGYGIGQAWYSPHHFSETHKYSGKRLYFLHELYTSISIWAPNELDKFVEKTKENGVNMYPYVESYLNYKK